jgi:hypothetical protein
MLRNGKRVRDALEEAAPAGGDEKATKKALPSHRQRHIAMHSFASKIREFSRSDRVLCTPMI